MEVWQSFRLARKAVPLGKVASPQAMTEGVAPTARLFPQETSAAAAVFLYDPTREKAILENPQIFQNCEI